MIVTTSPAAVVPASALNVFPHVAGRDTIATTLSPFPEIDPLVGTMPGRKELVMETASPEGAEVTSSSRPDEHPANASAEISKRYLNLFSMCSLNVEIHAITRLNWCCALQVTDSHRP
jgi:hypothetical protein